LGVVPDLPEQEAQKIYDGLSQRDILLYANEAQKEDKMALDSLVLQTLGLPTSILPDLHQTVAQYIEGRITKARRKITQKGRS